MAGNYIFIGPPGAGKGTMGDLFCKDFGVIHISTGELLRQEMAAGSELGLKVKELIKSGALVSDDIVTAMVAKRLAQPDVVANGCLLDGYPRTVAQADSLTEILKNNGTKLSAVVLIDADKAMLVGRLTARRMCSNKECGEIYNVIVKRPKQEGVCDKCGAPLYQRTDDSEETAVSRLKVYDEQTAPLIDYYAKRGELVTTKSTNGSIDENYTNMLVALLKAKQD